MKITVNYYNDVHLKIDCERNVSMEISDFFTFEVPGAKFTPAYKNKIWDGKIRLYDMRRFTLPVGLLDKLRTFANANEYEIDITFDPAKGNIEKIDAFVEYLDIHSGGKKIELRDYQLDAIKHSVLNRRAAILSPTSSGKSAIIYALVRYYQAYKTGRKKLIIVPNVSLVKQLYSDFNDYSSAVAWDVADSVHCITAGADKYTNKDIVITTWQSLIKIPANQRDEYFAQFDCLMVDEAHLAAGKSLQTISSALKDCSVRLGFTGTLHDAKSSLLQIIGTFGEVYKVISTKELMDKKMVAKLSIDCVVLRYKETERKMFSAAKMIYHDERDYITTHEARNMFVAKLAVKQPRNTLLMFTIIEHGKLLKGYIESLIDANRKVYFVDGSMKAEDRETIRQEIENEKNCIVIASDGVFSTGTSVKSLHTVIFAAPGKSKVRVLQTVGRGLRVNSEKDSVKLYDVVDDVSYKSRKNFALKHFIERADMYAKEQFDVNILKVDL